MKAIISLAGHGDILKNGADTTPGKGIVKVINKIRHFVYEEGKDNRNFCRALDILCSDSYIYENLIGNCPINVSLKDRIKTANMYDKNNSVLIDVHANAGQKSARGHVCFYYRFSKKSKLLAQCISKQLEDKSSIPSRGIKPSSWFYTLRKSTMPAVLVERYFFTNVTGRKIGSSQAEIDIQANAIKLGVDDYYAKRQTKTKHVHSII